MLNDFFKKEAFIVGFITVFMYTSVYFFERGSAVALHIPLDLITISLPTIINDYIHFFLFIFPIVAITFIVFKFLCTKESSRSRYLSAFFSGFVYAFSLLRYLEFGFTTIIMSLFLGGMYFVLLCLILDHHSIVLNDDERCTEKETNEDENFNSGLNKYYNNFVNLGLMIFLMASTFLLIGRDSINSDKFDSFSLGGSKYAIVKIYGDNVFTWQVVDGNLKKELTYFRVKDLNGVTLSIYSNVK
ncbi:hypothetical protein [Rahnella sp. Larv3_ips]|uniref:hypothetical protein n=1 Tax=Rahnella sp. Larv3_ips TaxID=1896943 RepID=UPI000EFB448F|nr:hypothetical protein [Rahnella sp. Larv3_ips]